MAVAEIKKWPIIEIPVYQLMTRAAKSYSVTNIIPIVLIFREWIYMMGNQYFALTITALSAFKVISFKYLSTPLLHCKTVSCFLAFCANTSFPSGVISPLNSMSFCTITNVQSLFISKFRTFSFRWMPLFSKRLKPFTFFGMVVPFKIRTTTLSANPFFYMPTGKACRIQSVITCTILAKIINHLPLFTFSTPLGTRLTSLSVIIKYYIQSLGGDFQNSNITTQFVSPSLCSVHSIILHRSIS